MPVRPRSSTLLFLLTLAALVPARAVAFHDGGVASCSGCHLMHAGSSTDEAGTTAGNPYLLREGNATDTCLVCHADYGQLRGGEGHGPGGDFYWVTRSYAWSTPEGESGASPGDSHGHNVISPGHGIQPDAQLVAAPGGTFLSRWLGCTSCHDPHGRDNFRMLYGSGEGPISSGSLRFGFEAPAPLARGNGPRTWVGAGGEETDARHTIYKSGMSEWCANCHPAFHSQGSTVMVHPAGDTLGSTIAANYNAYVSSEDPHRGDRGTAYRGLVPFEAVNVDLATADPTHATQGPTGTDRIMCLSCHRAHASPFADIGRWDPLATFLDRDSHPRAGDTGVSPSDVTHRYYEYDFPEGQRSLCNKCHVKDLGDRRQPS